MPSLLARARAALSGRYDITESLGEGGMAQVFLADDPRHERKVAVKVLRPEIAEQLGTERFTREIKLAAGLTHPHILPLHDSGEADGLLFAVMPVVDGRSLADLIAERGALPVEQALALALPLAQALGHAHAQGVVHRDVKPANVLLLSGEPMLADFGLARSDALEEDVQLTQVGDAMGTPSTMSPEQAGGRPADARSDVYSLGCVLFELLTGRPPFTGRSARELLTRHREDAPPDVAALRGDVPEGVATLLSRCLSKSPDDRPSDGNEVAAALDAELQALRSGVGPAVGAGSRRGFWGVAAVALVLAVALSLMLRAQLRRSWLEDEAFPALDAAIEEKRWEDAWATAQEIDAADPGNAALASSWDSFSGETEVISDPPGAAVSRRPIADVEGPWIPLGTTPLELRLPHGFHRLRFELEGHQPAEIASHWYYLRGQSTRLVAADRQRDGMTVVSGGRVALNIPGLDHLEAVELGSALLSVYETTHEEYAAFIEAGGYDDPSWWREPFVDDDGATLDFEQAMARFVDSTGRPGPSTWIAGDHPEGSDDHPVTGVSWFEAAAYCAWADAELPTVYHWNRAAETRLSQMVVPPSNFDGQGTVPVGSREALSAFGLHDLAGNAREWCLNATAAGQRAILGGGFDDLPYMFNDFFAQSPWDRSPSNGFRTMVPLEPSDEAVSGMLVPPFRDFRSEQVVPDEVFDVYRGLYRYDPLPLALEVLERHDDHDDYVSELLAYDLPYGDERGRAWLYTPRRGQGPFPCVVYFPGSNAIHSDDSSAMRRPRFGWLVKQGYAVIAPIYLGTYERGTELKSDYPDDSQRWRDHMVAWGMDLQRAVDVLESRTDCDAGRLAYFGVSWGGAMGPVMMVVEPRIDAGVLLVAGLLFQHARNEVDMIHYVPRVTQPVLMLNGAYDHFFPVETSQKPLFDLLGTPDDQKRYVLAEGGHSVPDDLVITEMLAWLDRWLGP